MTGLQVTVTVAQRHRPPWRYGVPGLIALYPLAVELDAASCAIDAIANSATGISPNAPAPSIQLDASKPTTHS